MKKLLYFFVFLLIAGAVSCSKDKLQPRAPKHVILKVPGQTVRDADQYTETHRETSDPSGYDAIANYVAPLIAQTIQNALKPDTGKTNAGAIAEVIGYYANYQWDHPKVKKDKIWEKIKVGIDKDLYRTCPVYCEYLEKKMRDYIESIVTGGPEWTTGVRENWREEALKNSIYDVDPKNQWKMTFYDELVAYYKSFAQNPKKKAKEKRNGWFIFGGGY
jgi:hypothetical protein